MIGLYSVNQSSTDLNSLEKDESLLMNGSIDQQIRVLSAHQVDEESSVCVTLRIDQHSRVLIKYSSRVLMNSQSRRQHVSTACFRMASMPVTSEREREREREREKERERERERESRM